MQGSPSSSMYGLGYKIQENEDDNTSKTKLKANMIQVEDITEGRSSRLSWSNTEQSWIIEVQEQKEVHQVTRD